VDEHRPTCVALVETKLRNSQHQDVPLQGYKLFHSQEWIAPSGKAHRGVGIYVRNGLQAELLPDHKQLDYLVGIKLIGKSRQDIVHMFVFYNAPGPRGERKARENELSAALRRWPGNQIVFTDFNDPTSDTAQRRFERLLTRHHLVALNSAACGDHCPTTTSGSHIIDWFLCTKEMLGQAQSCKILRNFTPTTHFPVELRLHTSPHTEFIPLAPPKRVWRHHNASDEQWAHYARETDASLAQLGQELKDMVRQGQAIEAESLDSMYQQLTQILTQSADQVIGRKTVQAHTHSPWWNSELQSLTRAIRKTKRWGKRGTIPPKDADSLVKGLQKHRHSLLQDMRIRESKRVGTIVSKGSSSMWKLLKRKLRSGSSLPPTVLDSDGTELKGSAMGLRLKDYWHDMGNHATNPHPLWSDEILELEQVQEEMICGPDYVEKSINRAISIEEVQEAIRGLKHKAAGVDEVQAFMLKRLGKQGVQFILDFFNTIWTHALPPHTMKQSQVTLIFKKGDIRDPGNYRPISVQCILAKVLSSIITTRMTEELETNAAIPEEQGAFRSKRGCPMHISSVVQLIQMQHERRLPTFSCFVDIAKAYDTCYRPALWAKLWDIGIQGRIWRYLFNFYQESESRIKLNEGYTEWFSPGQGVLQGDVASPLLYSVFISGVVHEINKLNLGVEINPCRKAAIFLWADDICLLAPDETQLQTLMDTLSEYANKWRFKVNPAKCNVVIFHKPRILHHSARAWYIQGQLVLEDSKYKYLGVWLQENGSYLTQFNSIKSKANWKIHEVITWGARDKYRFPPPASRSLIMAEVLPVLEWADAVWTLSQAQYDSLEALWNRALRLMVGVPKRCSIEAIIGDLNTVPLHLRRHWHTANLVYRLVSHGRGSLYRDIYESSYQMSTGSRYRPHLKWMKKVHDAFHALGIPQYMYPGMLAALETDEWRELIQKQVFHIRDREWSRSVNDPSRGHLSILKAARPAKPQRAKYLHCGTEPSLTRFICRLRGGGLPLAAAKHHENGICPMCLNCLETTTHFIFECPAYAHIRTSYRHRFPKNADLFTIKFRSAPIHSRAISDIIKQTHDTNHISHSITRMWSDMFKYRTHVIHNNPNT